MNHICTSIICALLCLTVAHAQQADDIKDDYIRFRMYADNGMYTDAYEHWWRVMSVDPTYNIHLYIDAPRMFGELINNEDDHKIREAYLDDMLTMFLTWQANIDSLNQSLGKSNRLTQADIELKKIYHYAVVAPNALHENVSRTFDEHKVYNAMRDAIALAGTDKLLNADMIKVYFDLSHGIYLDDREGFAAQFTDDYNAMRDVCEQAIEALTMTQETRNSTKALKSYMNILEYIKAIHENP